MTSAIGVEVWARAAIAPHDGQGDSRIPRRLQEELGQQEDQWLTVVEAARHLRYPCTDGRAPNSVYEIAEVIGHKANGRWLISLSDLNDWVRDRSRA